MNKFKQMLLRKRFMDEFQGTDAVVSGGVGNGQATGTGQVSENFDTSKALDSISSSLFGSAQEPAHEDPKEPIPVPAEQKGTETDLAVAAPAESPAPVQVAQPAPKTWKPEEQATWDQIPEQAKAAILRREEDIFKGIEQYKQPAELGNKVNEALKPYAHVLASANVDSVAMLKGLIDGHATLTLGSPMQKAQMFAQLAKDYGVNMSLTGLVQADPTDPVPDPEVLRLQEENHRLQLAQQTAQAQRQAEVRERTARQINEFAADPKNPHFDKVADLMVPLLQDPNVTLREAYDKAIWMHPEVRELEMARIAAEKHAKAIAEGKEKAEAARKAQAANVKVGPKAGAATMPLGSMDDTLAEAMAAIKAR